MGSILKHGCVQFRKRSRINTRIRVTGEVHTGGRLGSTLADTRIPETYQC